MIEMGGTPFLPIGGGEIAGKGVLGKESESEWTVWLVAYDCLKFILELESL